MTPSAAMKLVRELRAMGATRVRVGDVEAEFGPAMMPLEPVPPRHPEDFAEPPEVVLAKRMKALEKDLGISLT